ARGSAPHGKGDAIQPFGHCSRYGRSPRGAVGTEALRCQQSISGGTKHGHYHGRRDKEITLHPKRWSRSCQRRGLVGRRYAKSLRHTQTTESWTSGASESLERRRVNLGNGSIALANAGTCHKVAA